VASLGIVGPTFSFVAVVKWPMEFLVKYGTQLHRLQFLKPLDYYCLSLEYLLSCKIDTFCF
jgi:hypothetical protein